jgi:hypothetical protein
MDLLTTFSEITTVTADLLIILPFLSRTIRRKLFKAVIVDIIYDIVNGSDGQTADMINTLKTLVKFYDDMRKGNNPSVNVQSKDD